MGRPSNTSKNRFAIYARRNSSEKWTDWATVPFRTDVRRHVRTIRLNGYQAKVIDHETRDEAYFGCPRPPKVGGTSNELC